MANEEKEVDKRDKGAEKGKYTHRVEVSCTTSRKDATKVITTPSGTRHQDPKTGKFCETIFLRRGFYV